MGQITPSEEAFLSLLTEFVQQYRSLVDSPEIDFSANLLNDLHFDDYEGGERFCQFLAAKMRIAQHHVEMMFIFDTSTLTVRDLYNKLFDEVEG